MSDGNTLTAVDIVNIVGCILTGCALLGVVYVFIRARVESELETERRLNVNFLTDYTVRRIGLTLANAHCKAGKLKDGTTRKAWADGYIEAMTDMLLTMNIEFREADGVITIDGQTFIIPEKEMFPL